MGKDTKIEWTDSTWNPWQGCRKISYGCKHCYMFEGMRRFGKDPEKIVRSSPATFYAPLHWKEPRRVFTCSWSDFFIEEADFWRVDAWDVIRHTPHLTYQILTKRPERIMKLLPFDWLSGDVRGWSNVWLGVTVEANDDKCYRRLDELARIPARVKFVSCEPLLGQVNLEKWIRDGAVDWVISGGESGDECREPDPDWFRSLRDQCSLYGIPFFHKQNGGTMKSEGAWGGKRLDGEIYQAFPKGG